MLVKKIDTSIFNDIKTGVKTNDEFYKNASAVMKNFYKKWRRRLNIDTDDIIWFTKNHKKIYKIIELDKILKSSSKRISYEAIANILLLIDKDKYKSYAKDLFIKSIDIQKKINIKDNDQLIEKDNITFKDLVKARTLLSKTWKHNKRDHMIYLYLCLNTYMPPLRLDYLNFKAIKLCHNNKFDNCMDYDNGQYILYINKDKVSNKKQHEDNTLNFSINHLSKMKKRKYIDGVMMTKILNQSFNILPRNYIITSITDINKPMNSGTLFKLLNVVLGEHLGQNDIRKAYINHWYKPIFKLNLNEKNIIAKYMRNSQQTAEAKYIKLDFTN